MCRLLCQRLWTLKPRGTRTIATSTPGCISLIVSKNGMMPGLILSRHVVITHSSSRSRVSPTMRPSSSTPSTTIPPSRFENATSSRASSWFCKTSRLNSTPELSPLATISRSSVRVVMVRTRTWSGASRRRPCHLPEFPRPDPARHGSRWRPCARAQSSLGPSSASPNAASPRINSASPSTGMFALCVEKTNWRRRFSRRIGRNDALGDEPIVEVVFGLVHHQRRPPIPAAGAAAPPSPSAPWRAP